MHRSKNSFLEWLVYSLIFFFLYDIIWILVDLPDFLQSVSGLYPELLVDFALCGLFSLSSLYLNRWLFRQRRFWREGQGHRVFVQNGLVVLGFNQSNPYALMIGNSLANAPVAVRAAISAMVIRMFMAECLLRLAMRAGFEPKEGLHK